MTASRPTEDQVLDILALGPKTVDELVVETMGHWSVLSDMLRVLHRAGRVARARVAHSDSPGTRPYRYWLPSGTSERRVVS